MAGQGIRKSTRWLRFFLGLVVAFSGSLLFLMDGACQAQAAESAQGRGKWCQEEVRLNRRLSPHKPPTVSGSCSNRSFLLSELHACHQSIR